jgi:hypothetical protein
VRLHLCIFGYTYAGAEFRNCEFSVEKLNVVAQIICSLLIFTAQDDNDNDYGNGNDNIIPNSAEFPFLEGLSQKPSGQEQKQHNI